MVPDSKSEERAPTGSSSARRRLGVVVRQLLRQLQPVPTAGRAGEPGVPGRLSFCQPEVLQAAPPEVVFGPQKGLFSAKWCPGKTNEELLSDARLKELFGPKAYSEGPLAKSGLGRRFHHVDLSKQPLSPEQAAFCVDALSVHGVVSFPGQDLENFSLAHYERFANHFGAVVPHPNNFTRGEDGMHKGKHDSEIPNGIRGVTYFDGRGNYDLKPEADQDRTRVNRAFPGKVMHKPHASPAIFSVTNVVGGGENTDRAKLRGGGVWHTDQEHEPVPMGCSMFLVHHVPTGRDSAGGTWIGEDYPRTAAKSYLPDTDPELIRLREEGLPLNGETPYCDCAAAFAALPKAEQEKLEKVYVRRRWYEGDAGWLAPIVQTNPRSGVKSLHTPVWGNRIKGQKLPPFQVEGMTMEESREFLDRLEAHILQPQFRHNQAHTPGDVTIWNNLATLHCTAPTITAPSRVEDARLLYRCTTKGPPALTLPRRDDPAWIEGNVQPPYTSPPELLNAVGRGQE